MRRRHKPLKGPRCKLVVVRGKRRKMCWGSNGKLISNKKV